MELYNFIQETFPILENKYAKQDIKHFANTEYTYRIAFHYGMGAWIRDNLLGRDTPLYEAFLRAGVTHAEEMSRHVITLFYFHLRTRAPQPALQDTAIER